MTIAWAIIIVVILWMLFKSGRLKQSLVVAAIIVGVVVVGWFLLWLGALGYDRYEVNQKRKQREQAAAQYAQQHDCLNTITGKLSAVYNYPLADDTDVSQMPAPPPPPAGSTELLLPAGSTPSSPPAGLTPLWCGANEIVHTKGADVDPWQVVGEFPTIPAGDYTVKNGYRDTNGNLKTGAAIYGWHRSYTMPSDWGCCYGDNARIELKKSAGGNLLVFSADKVASGTVIDTMSVFLANVNGKLTAVNVQFSHTEGASTFTDGVHIARSTVAYDLWNTDFSPMPLIVEVGTYDDYDTQYSDVLQYLVQTYAYSKNDGQYTRIDSYVTDGVYDRAAPDKVLESEKATELKRLKGAADSAAPRTIQIGRAK